MRQSAHSQIAGWRSQKSKAPSASAGGRSLESSWEPHHLFVAAGALVLPSNLMAFVAAFATAFVAATAN